MIIIHRRFDNAAFFSFFFFLRFLIFLFSSSDEASLSARPVERIDKSHTIRLVPRGILRAVIKAVNYFFLPCAIIHSTLHKGSASERASENETRDRTFRAIYVTKGSPRARTRRIPFSLSLSRRSDLRLLLSALNRAFTCQRTRYNCARRARSVKYVRQK